MTADPMAVLGALVLEDGRTWGEAARPFQVDDARAILADQTDTPYSYITRPRGASKTSDLAGIGLAWLVTHAPAGARGYAVAADRDQARLLLDAASGFLARTPGLGGAVAVEAWRIVHRQSGASIEALAADGPSAYGLRPAFVIVDEIGQWASTSGPRTVWDAIFTSVVKVPDCRLVVLTTASDPAHFSYQILEHARREARWRTAELPGPCPWLDPAALAEQERLLLPSVYARLHLNVWTAPEDRLTTRDALARCVVLDGPQDPVPGTKYVITLDIGLKSDRTVAVVAHVKPRAGEDGAAVTVVLDRIAVWAGTRKEPVSLDGVEAWLAQASRDYNGARVVADPYQAAQLLERLRARQVRAEDFPFTAQSVGRLAHRLYSAIRDAALELPNDADLLDELAHVQLRETSPGVYRLDHDSGRHDDRAIALALAVNWLSDRGHRRGFDPEMFTPVSLTKLSYWRSAS